MMGRQTEYQIGYEDGVKGHARRVKDSSLETLFGFSGLRLPKDFDYDEYNRGYDQGERRAKKESMK